MPGIQQKITGHAKRQENTTENEDKNQSIEHPEMTKKIDLVEKGVKTIIITIFKKAERKRKHDKERHGRYKRPKSNFER